MTATSVPPVACCCLLCDQLWGFGSSELLAVCQCKFFTLNQLAAHAKVSRANYVLHLVKYDDQQQRWGNCANCSVFSHQDQEGNALPLATRDGDRVHGLVDNNGSQQGAQPKLGLQKA